MGLLRYIGLMLATMIIWLQPILTWANPPKHKLWVQSFQEEFNGKHLNYHKWSTSYPNGRHTNISNHEQQWYVDDALSVKKGYLYISASRQEKTIHPEYHYVSGLITTHDSFAQQYGYFEIRAKVPKGQGLWPAFWMLPVTNQDFPENHDFPEIDVLETFGTKTQQPFQTYFTWDKMSKAHKFLTITKTPTDLSKAFHTYGLYWDKDMLQWFIDNKLVAETRKSISHVPMYMLLNLALQADTVHHSTVADNTALNAGIPARYIIDYVCVYREKAGNY